MLWTKKGNAPVFMSVLQSKTEQTMHFFGSLQEWGGSPFNSLWKQEAKSNQIDEKICTFLQIETLEICFLFFHFNAKVYPVKTNADGDNKVSAAFAEVWQMHNTPILSTGEYYIILCAFPCQPFMADFEILILNFGDPNIVNNYCIKKRNCWYSYCECKIVFRNAHITEIVLLSLNILGYKVDIASNKRLQSWR